jgi:hypothetical protein
MTDVDPDAAARRPVSKRDLFLGFLKIGLSGFRGVAPWARHVIIEQRRWVGLLKEGLVPIALGLVLASGVAMMRTADRDY